MIIYKILNKMNGKVYIGQTIRSLRERWMQHASGKEGCTALEAAISKYSVEAFEITIIARCNTLDELNHREELYIKLFKSMSPNGYNLVSGGKRWKISETTRARMTEANRKNGRTEESRNTQRVLRNIFFVKNPDFGRKHSLKLKAYFSDPSKRELNAKANGSILFVALKDSVEVWRGYSQGLCAEVLGLDQGNISNCLKGKRNHTKGYTFEAING